MIQITDNASHKVKALLEAEIQEGEAVEGSALRVEVSTGGCAGFVYEMHFDNDISEHEWSAEVNGVRVAVDPLSALHLIGATLDYKEGLQGAGFVWNNPSATRTCGCNKSFS